MAENSNIAWTDDTFNPVVGCQPISPGCAHCYAKAMVERYGKDFSIRRRTSEDNWKKPIKWNKKPLICDKCGNAESNLNRLPDPICGNCGGSMHRRRVFCASMADWLDDQWPIEVLADLLKLIHDTPNLDWQLLTKRPENWRKRIDAVCKLWACDGSYMETSEAWAYHEMLCPWRSGYKSPHNVWIGTTAENQEYADKRIPELLNIPAKVRFLSCEPLLGPVQIEEYLGDVIDGGYVLGSTPIHWVICGGESGKDARPMELQWASDLMEQCAGEAAFFMKQDSGPRSGMRGRIPNELWVQEFPR